VVSHFEGKVAALPGEAYLLQDVCTLIATAVPVLILMLGKRAGPSDLTIVAPSVGISVIVIHAREAFLTADIALQVTGHLVYVNGALEIVAPLAEAILTELVRAENVSHTAGVVALLVMVSIHVPGAGGSTDADSAHITEAITIQVFAFLINKRYAMRTNSQSGCDFIRTPLQASVSWNKNSESLCRIGKKIIGKVGVQNVVPYFLIHGIITKDI
jgi:hypothetical protein